MAILPDTKNWIWTAERRCPDCGFDASAIDVTTVPGRLRETAAGWPAVLRAEGVRLRPDDQTWSPLEYGAHVRDVHRIFGDRLQRFLTEENPTLPNWDQDAAAEVQRYNEQNPETVADELVRASENTAAGFDAVLAPDWVRTASRSDGATFTLDTFARYYLHDVVHHLWDVTAGAPLSGGQ